MSIEELRCLSFMALRTNLAACNQGKEVVVRTVGVVAGRAIFSGRWVKRTVTPVLGHFTVTTKTQRWLVFRLVPWMG